MNILILQHTRGYKKHFSLDISLVLNKKFTNFKEIAKMRYVKLKFNNIST